MNELVTIVVSAGGTSEQMLRTCLCSLERHRGKVPFKILVVAPSHQSSLAQTVSNQMRIESMGILLNSADELSGSRTHAKVLDLVLGHIDTPYILTLDVDCFPIADDWLDVLVEDMANGASVTGIMHPFAPPPPNMATDTIEWRIRSQLCRNNTHVACQLVALNTLSRLKVGFSDGDDTGLAIPTQARAAGMKVNGLLLTGCAQPVDNSEDLEFNREHCLIFGNKVYHHGGGCREEQGKGSPSDIWRLIRKRVFDEGGAEFLLEDPYRYSFDQEEEVAAKMVERITGGMQIYLKTHDKLF